MATLNKCPDCGKQQFYHRVKTDDFKCQKCGCVWKKEEPKTEEP